MEFNFIFNYLFPLWIKLHSMFLVTYDRYYFTVFKMLFRKILLRYFYLKKDGDLQIFTSF